MIRVHKSVRNAVVSALVLLFVFVGGGIAYVWYSGQGAAVKPVAASPVAQTEAAPVIQPHKPAANAKESVAVESLTTPVQPGANASMLVRTLAGSSCTISVLYNNVPSKDSGLIPKVADDFGSVSWSWSVAEETPVGHAPVTVTCTHGTQSAVVQDDLVVTK